MEIKFERILNIANNIVLNQANRRLTDVEITVLKGCWNNESYDEISAQNGYSSGYLSRDVAPKLWKIMTDAIGEPIRKSNFKEALKSYWQKQISSENIVISSSKITMTKSFPYPTGPISLDSPFYIQRACLEKEIYQQIQKSGTLIRIKAPQERGKSSLVLRILEYCKTLEYQTVNLNIEKIDRASLKNLNQFLRRLCKYIAKQLQLDPKLDEYWDEDLDSKMNWTIYFEDYLLETIDNTIVLAFDEINYIFEYPQLAQDFFALLRSCYEDAQRMPLWKKLRLIITYSTEIYIPLHLNQSPFNVGIPIALQEFSMEEAQILAAKYEAELSCKIDIIEIMELLGGHPALVHLTIYNIACKQISFSEILKTAFQFNGIYGNHLQRHWVILTQQKELLNAIKLIMNANQPVPLDPIICYKLNSMGLIKETPDGIIPFCNLYRNFFNLYLNKSESVTKPEIKSEF